jgi:NAD-dependent SIR2 family protein deacetylase
MKVEFEPFIKDFVRDLHDNNVAIFAGAGMSKPAGYVNWKELLTDIATDLKLDIDKENDLVSLAQFHVTENNNRHKINQKILDELTEGSNPTENHEILSRLPITTYWTTNYDTLIEKSLENNKKRVAKKSKETHLSNSIYKRIVLFIRCMGMLVSLMML